MQKVENAKVTFYDYKLIYPGRRSTLANDRLWRETEIYGGRTHVPYTELYDYHMLKIRNL